MNNLPAALGWLGLALILFPFALFCVAVAIAVTPGAGLILLVMVAAFAAGRLEKRWKRRKAERIAAEG